VPIDGGASPGQSPRMNRLALVVLLALAACAPRLIPGTDTPNTSDHRAVWAVVEQYRMALEKRDPAAILALVAPGYYDAAGTPDPSDDLDRGRLEASLTEDLGKAESLRVEFTIRKIDVNGEEAQAEVFYDEYYRVKTKTVVVPRRDSDVHRMRLRRIDHQWKFVSGL
jgi:hypothetical protein